MLRALRWLIDRLAVLCPVFLVLALVLAMGAAGLTYILGRDTIPVEISTVGFEVAGALFLLCFLLFKLSGGLKWYMGRGARKGDPANPKILYLRSFYLDGRAATSFIGFEEAVLAKLRMPIVAVANPGKARNANEYFGVQRVRLSEQDHPGISAVDWQGRVEEMIRRAEIVLIMFSDSTGVCEEVSMAISLGVLEKTALVLPWNDHWNWAAALEHLPDEVMRECLRRRKPSAAIISSFRRTMKEKIREHDWLLEIIEEGPTQGGRHRVRYAPAENSVPRKEGVVADFRNYMERARKTQAKARESPRGPSDPLEPLVHLAWAGCPTEMLALIHVLVSEGISGMTFAKHFHLWALPKGVEAWGPELATLVEEMVRFLAERTGMPKN